jgi:hypothetical protein
MENILELMAQVEAAARRNAAMGCEVIALGVATGYVDGDRLYENGWRAAARLIAEKIAALHQLTRTDNSDSPDSQKRGGGAK